jgi:DNA repair protein RecO (recombination protein O)
MLDDRATGLILRTYPLTETSLIVHWLTAESGRLATVAKGARRPKSPFRGKLDLYYLADFSFQRSRRSELHLLKEIRIQQTHPGLRQDIGYLRQAAYCATLIEQTTEIDTPLPACFHLLHGLIERLPRQPPEPITVLAFEARLLEELGLRPAPGPAELSGGARRLLTDLADLPWGDPTSGQPAWTHVIELSRFLEHFWRDHLGKVPRGREAAVALKPTQLNPG